MTELGETIKKIRKGKGILQKDLYQDIVSNTFATQFEKGVYRINADAFLEILNRLSMNSNEFQKIHANYQMDEYALLSYAISDAINQKDIPKLEQLVLKLQDHRHIAQHSLLRSLAVMNICRLKGDTLPENSEDVKVIMKFLSKIDNWTLSDVAFLTNFLPFIPYNMLLIQVKMIEEKLKNQNELRLLCYFYTNLLDRAFLEEDYQNAEIISRRLKGITQEPEFLFFKLIAQLYLDLLQLMTDFDFSTMERVDAMITFLDQQTTFDLSGDLSEFIDHLKEKHKYT